ncbi:hypothetical protein IQ07DRAFT_585519 [Pyrenochaeta sp. DS3sAY3a]|nr:hypothetical protein IQ07DRAFT_585519 [Pyrenochaeta sp. DS3sAY3a]
MAPRGRSAVASDMGDHSYESSPDPLASSFRANNNTNPRASRKSTHRAPFAATSPSKQNRRSSVSEFEFSSPSKSLIMDTPRKGGASPWRIKVTVEAEPGPDEENEPSPSIKRVTRTKTTTVPLKDPDASSPVKRPRGRPRKSDIGVATKPKRVGTPVKRAARSRSRDADARATDSNAADVDTDVPPKKKRGRPRKSIQPLQVDEEPRIVPEPAARDGTPDATHIFAHTQHARSMEEPHVITPIASTTIAVRSNTTSPFGERSNRRVAVEQGPSSRNTSQQTELGKSLRARKGTPHAKKVAIMVPTDDESDEHPGVLTPSSENDEVESGQTTRTVEEDNGYVVAGETDAEMVYAPASENDDEEDQDMTNYAFDEGVTRMPDDTTIVDSENFSMISVDSLHSIGIRGTPQQPEVMPKSGLPSIASTLQQTYLTEDQTMPRANVPQLNVVPPISSLRYKTPVNDLEVPPIPPVIEPFQVPVPKTGTPKLGRAVTAGVALQGLLDPTRITPEPSQKVLDERRDRLDDLFRGFSEGTRKELQAGLRLGEQLAEGNGKDQATSTASSDQTKAQPQKAAKEGVYRTQRKYRQPRLLTPEDQDDFVITAMEQPLVSNDVQYLTLDTEGMAKTLLSPAGSEDEMSWRVDTPPVTKSTDMPMEGLSRAVPTPTSNSQEQIDYSDIWQEEASRSSELHDIEEAPLGKESQKHDLFAGDGPVKPTRGKLPRTWRRKGANNFHYSDEAESPEQSSSKTTDPAQVITPVLNHVEQVEVVANGEQQIEEEEDASDASEDTGMFFHSNMPNLFNRQRFTEHRQQRANQVNLSVLLNEGESLAPESSPPVASRKPSPPTQTNPFLDTPPKMAAQPSSPKKSSPLRQELRGSDISSSSPRRFADESTLPIVQSSPFHTYVDGVSETSDQRQFRVEMEGSTASSIRQVRHEANEYLNAYEQQERSLEEIEEVTEPSHTWQHQSSHMASSPPQMKKAFAQSMLSPTRKSRPLFSNHQDHEASPSPRPVEVADVTESDEESDDTYEEEESEYVSEEYETDDASEEEDSLSGSELSLQADDGPMPTNTPRPHPILAKCSPLPKIGPWTQTHYLTLLDLYFAHLEHPQLFSRTIAPNSRLSQTNHNLLHDFLINNPAPYVGCRFSIWGYSMIMTEELVTICAVYMKLLSLADMEAYEALTGKPIDIGGIGAGTYGHTFVGDNVIVRLASIVMGQDIRRDMAKGIEIVRKGSIKVQWPNKKVEGNET